MRILLLSLFLFGSLSTQAFAAKTASKIITGDEADRMLSNVISMLASGDKETLKDFFEDDATKDLKINIIGGTGENGEPLTLSARNLKYKDKFAPIFNGGMPFGGETFVARDNRSAAGHFQLLSFNQNSGENKMTNIQSNCSFSMILDNDYMLRLSKLECRVSEKTINLSGSQ
ncbi:MAG: hypothetical protein CMH30_07065 [Micavibrio sp.]|nr:hypothetical protein [Micavibrio sp.]|tara:strand:+ start:1785 stop:2303 length:519 start_codon:yes stop_codon:yes gene_type:complete